MILTPEQKADGWIEHDGGDCPVPLDSKPAVLWGDGWVTSSGTVSAAYWCDSKDSWRHEGQEKHHIIAYRPEQSK